VDDPKPPAAPEPEKKPEPEPEPEQKPAPKPPAPKEPKHADALAEISRRVSSVEAKVGASSASSEKAPGTPVLLVIAVVGTLVAAALLAVWRFVLNRAVERST